MNISRSLKSFSETGLGGVNLVFILDVNDPLAPRVEFLSKKWVELVTFTVGQARQLGMDVDIAPVSGWAFGGSSVARPDACSVIMMRKLDPDFRSRGEFVWDRGYGGDFKYDDMEAVLAVSDRGQRFLVTDKIRRNGSIEWEEPEGKWTYYVTINHPGSSMVRFPSSDQRGFVIDLTKEKAVKEYFSRFTSAFSAYDRKSLPRAYNVDSWEINLNWTRGFYDEFLKRRGYDLRLYIPELFRYATDETSSRVICDYRETLSDLLIENYNRNFHLWAKEIGGAAIGEIYSQPSNILDANAFLDIPQMDLGGRLEYFQQNGRYITENLDWKCSSSAASILGKPLVSSETLTCMGPVFNTPFDICKKKLDWDFVNGVNHTCFHGITYSPLSAGWPGWLFYAGTHLGDFNPLWQLTGLNLNNYITKVQSFMQLGRPDKDILFYFPYYDKFSRLDSEPGSAPYWWTALYTKDYPVAQQLMESGSDFDFVSDKMLLNDISTSGGLTVSKANQYKAILVADCHLIPGKTLRRILDLAEGGATVLMVGEMPQDVPGMYNLAERRKQFYEMMESIRSNAKMPEKGISVSKKDSGRIIMGSDIIKVSKYAGIARESLVDDSLKFTRRRDDEGWIYFVVNPSGQKIDKWIPLATKGSCAALFDPMTGRKGMASYHIQSAGCRIFLQLEPAQSVIVKVYDKVIEGEKWNYLSYPGAPVRIDGKWDVSFISGGEKIPHDEEITQLSSWTEWNSAQAPVLRGFSGIAKYRISFEKPACNYDDLYLSLGEVSHSAKVIINGNEVGGLFTKPMKISCGKYLKDGTNVLEIQVANTAINRIAYLDQNNIKWYYETGGMDLSSCDWDNTKKDSSWIPVQSGLIGPVELIPVSFVKP